MRLILSNPAMSNHNTAINLLFDFVLEQAKFSREQEAYLPATYHLV